MTTINIIWIIFLAALVYLAMSKGSTGKGCCGGEDQNSGEQDSQLGKEKNHQGHRHLTESTDNSKDPVCGMMVRGETLLISEHFGKTYQFCSDQCKKIFELNPNKYVH